MTVQGQDSPISVIVTRCLTCKNKDRDEDILDKKNCLLFCWLVDKHKVIESNLVLSNLVTHQLIW